MLNLFELPDPSVFNVPDELMQQQEIVSSGNIPSLLMAIGLAPSMQDEAASQLLTKILASEGIDRQNDVFISTLGAPIDALQQCKPFLIRQIHLVKPRILILFGPETFQFIVNDQLSFDEQRGNWLQSTVTYMDDLLYIMPMYSLSFLLKSESKEKNSPKWQTWEDIKEVKAALDYYHALEENQ